MGKPEYSINNLIADVVASMSESRAMGYGQVSDKESWIQENILDQAGSWGLDSRFSEKAERILLDAYPCLEKQRW